MFCCGEGEITDAVGMSHRRSQLASFIVKIWRAGGANFRHNLGTVASGDGGIRRRRDKMLQISSRLLRDAKAAPLPHSLH